MMHFKISHPYKTLARNDKANDNRNEYTHARDKQPQIKKISIRIALSSIDFV